MYQNYLFDLYGTLVDINTNERKSLLWRNIAMFYAFNGANYNPKEFHKRYIFLCNEEEKKLNYIDYPEIKIEKVFEKLFLEKNIKPKKELVNSAAGFFRIESIKYIRLYDGAIELLKGLKAANKKVYLLSNAQRVFTEPEMRMLNIYDIFDGVVISSDEKCRKPSKDFYNVIIDRYNLEKNKTIMIGNDYITDIKGSYDAGLDSLYIHSNISPEIKGELLSKYSVLDGDVRKVKDIILK